MSYGEQTRNPYEDDRSEPENPEAEHFYPCSCGDPNCIADDRDTGNIRIGTGWYASDCVMANQLQAIVDGRAHEARIDERAGK